MPLLPDAAPSHGALDSGPGPLGDTMTSSRGGSSSRPRIATCPGWPTALRSSAFVQATTVRSAAPQTFAVGLGIVPRAAGARVRRLRASSLPGPRQRPSVFTERRFAIHSRHHSCHAASTALATVNGGEHRAASATRTAANTALPVQRERQRAPRCQRNANGGERCAASATRTAASATRTAASAALPAQRERRRAPRCQRNANGSRLHRAASATRTAASATRTAASAVLPAQRKRQRGLRWPRNGRVARHGARRVAWGASCGMGRVARHGARRAAWGDVERQRVLRWPRNGRVVRHGPRLRRGDLGVGTLG